MDVSEDEVTSLAHIQFCLRHVIAKKGNKTKSTLPGTGMGSKLVVRTFQITAIS